MALLSLEKDIKETLNKKTHPHTHLLRKCMRCSSHAGFSVPSHSVSKSHFTLKCPISILSDRIKFGAVVGCGTTPTTALNPPHSPPRPADLSNITAATNWEIRQSSSVRESTCEASFKLLRPHTPRAHWVPQPSTGRTNDLLYGWSLCRILSKFEYLTCWE